MAYIFLAVAIVFGILYLIKVANAKKLYSKAEDAKTQGDDKSAVSLYKQALGFSNDKPDKEMDILSELKTLYSKHGLVYDFSDYEKLIDQFRTLSKKSSNKAIREMGEVNKIKNTLIEMMPDLP